ncbi:MAG: recombinase family protein [Polynucleobacter sp.]
MTRIAIYARFSTDKQRDSSIEDQVRNCMSFASGNQWVVIDHFEDRAISGASKDRPGFQKMLKAAQSKEFDVLLVDDLSRLSRDDIETKQVIRRFKYQGLRIIGVSDGYDSSGKGEKIQTSMRGLMNELYLDDLREKTHRGMAGQAGRGYSTGGRCYGYEHRQIQDASKSDAYGRPMVVAVRREINPDQAKIIVHIYERFSTGWSPRAIARELNEMGIPSPRGGKWLQSAIYGDQDEGTGILNNWLYGGRCVWNRREWRKNPDTGKRTYVQRPESEWVIKEMDDLRIISPELWDKVKARQAFLRSEQGERVRLGLRASSASTSGCSTGRGPKYLFSGLLKCFQCGANFVMHSATSYACAKNINGGHAACSNHYRLPRRKVEKRLLEVIKQELLTPEASQQFAVEVKNELMSRAKEFHIDVEQAQTEVKKSQREIDNIMAAIKAGVLTESTKEGLVAAEGRKAQAQKRLEAASLMDERAVGRLMDLLPKALERYRMAIDSVETVLGSNLEHSRTILKELLGDIQLSPEKHGLEAVLNVDWTKSLSFNTPEEAEKLKVLMVAGAGFEPTTFGL